MNTRSTSPAPGRSLNAFVAAIVAAGAASVAAAAVLLPSGETNGSAAAIILAVIVLGTWYPVNVRHQGGVQGFTIEEAGYLALLFVLPLAWAPLAMASAAALVHSAKSRDVKKVAFNVGQVGLWSTAAAVTFHLVGPGDSVVATRSLLAAVAVMVVLNAVSLVSMAELFRRLDGRMYRETIAAGLQLNVVTMLGNTVLGLLLAFTAVTDPRATVVAAIAVVISSMGYRWYAMMMDQRPAAPTLRGSASG